MSWLEGTVPCSGSNVLADLPDHVTWEGLHLEVQRRHGKPIHIVPAPAGLGQDVTGLWLEKAEQSWIFHAAGESELLRRHVILHEYGHILLMHGGCELTLGNAFSHIGGSRRIKTLLGRSSIWTAQEVAAEDAATRLASRLTQKVDPLLEAF
ncbi:hypothetical protein KFL01_14700 [Kocuria flava]|uniref:IrrE N-terminal-like domain-containing protein n=1 Tax=Kocuria flava TaxID=446860 RepID=A0ABQ0X943_9MICC|nr:hypothetical protein KFL01_14700 [Kocuria flava]